MSAKLRCHVLFGVASHLRQASTTPAAKQARGGEQQYGPGASSASGRAKLTATACGQIGIVLSSLAATRPAASRASRRAETETSGAAAASDAGVGRWFSRIS